MYDEWKNAKTFQDSYLIRLSNPRPPRDDGSAFDSKSFDDQHYENRFQVDPNISSKEWDKLAKQDPEFLERCLEGFEHVMKHLSLGRYKALYSMIFRSYWEHLWIVPEVALAKEVFLYCGERRMAWDNVEKALKLLEEIEKRVFDPSYTPLGSFPFRSQSCFFNLQQLRRERWSKKDRSLPELLKAFGHLKCSEIRDRVYALLGKNTYFREDRSSIVDYGSPVEELFLNVLRFCASMREIDSPLQFCKELLELLNLRPREVLDWLLELPKLNKPPFEDCTMLICKELVSRTALLGDRCNQKDPEDSIKGINSFEPTDLSHLKYVSRIHTKSEAREGNYFYHPDSCSAGAIYRLEKKKLQANQSDLVFIGMGIASYWAESKTYKRFFQSHSISRKMSTFLV